MKAAALPNFIELLNEGFVFSMITKLQINSIRNGNEKRTLHCYINYFIIEQTIVCCFSDIFY